MMHDHLGWDWIEADGKSRVCTARVAWASAGKLGVPGGNVFAYQNADLRLDKGVTLARGQQASIVVDLFNVFNSTNWDCYETTIIPTADQATDANW
jgi:hypothetical protein